MKHLKTIDTAVKIALDKIENVTKGMPEGKYKDGVDLFWQQFYDDLMELRTYLDNMEYIKPEKPVNLNSMDSKEFDAWFKEDSI